MLKHNTDKHAILILTASDSKIYLVTTSSLKRNIHFTFSHCVYSCLITCNFILNVVCNKEYKVRFT